jgi:hypothetical protein
MTPAPAQLWIPGFPVPAPPLESEVKTILLPIEVTDRGADLRFVAMCRMTYPTVGDACQAAERMGLTNV